MAYDTKADFDNAYQFRVDRYFNRDNPGVAQDPAQTGEVILHYHRFFMSPILADMWARLAPILNIASTEHVLIVGAGFGWGVEAFIAETGCTTVGIDVSDYINAEKNNTEETEIDAAIVAAGLDPAAGRGAAIKAYVYDAQPRTNVIVLQENAQTNTSRQAIRAALGNNWPDVCIVEDLIDAATTDAEITQVNNALNLFAGNQRVIYVTGKGYPGRTLAQLQALTAAEVITRDGVTHLVP
jgi:hypothetical protein